MKDGIFKNIKEEVYHKIDALGSTPLKKFHDRPSSIFEPVTPSEDMRLGSGQDAYSLVGPEYFHKTFVVQPDFGDMRKADNKKQAMEFQLENAGKVILPATVTPKNLPTMKAIIDVDNFLFKEHPLTKQILRTGEQQVSLMWTDIETGTPCKGRLDHLPDPKFKTIFDLKKCAQIDRFVSQARKLRYSIQSGHYSSGAIQLGIEVEAFGFIAFNFGDPPEVDVVIQDADDFLLSQSLAKTTVRLIAECREANYFPNYKIPFDTVSMTKILGLKTEIANQLEPWQLGRIVKLAEYL